MLKNESKILNEFFMKDLDVTLALVDELGDEVDNDVIQLYFFIKNNIKEINIIEINIIEAKSIYEEIEFRGYSKLDDIIMYSKLKNLREYVSGEIDEILSSSYQIDRLFDKETIIDYFLEGTSIEEIARKMIDNYDEYEEVLDIEPEIMFESKYGQAYYYAYVNN